MSLRLEMLQVARLAPAVLGPDASKRIEAFVRSTELPEGGFRDREGKPDLYYTSFAVDALTALQAELPPTLGAWLATIDPTSLDLVHLASLSRVAAAVASSTGNESPVAIEPIFELIEAYRSGDGGYHANQGSETGSGYGCFVAYGAYSDHHRMPPNPEGMVECMRHLEQADGGWSNDRHLPIANVPSTAASMTLYRNLRLPVPDATEGFVRSCFHAKAGGFVPFPRAPLPDLLSTAVALHTLDRLQADLTSIKETCLDFIDSLWTADGGFVGNWDDDTLDVEYTYYGLLALGHLAL